MIASGPSDIDPHVAPLSPTQSFQRLHECGDRGGLVCFDCPAHEHADVPHAVSFLRARRERPRGYRAAKQRDELATLHSITSSASCWRCKGTSRPSALAVLRLVTSSNLVGCMTGRSAGFSPLRIRPT